MNNSNFVHLHLHDHYSALDGYGTAAQYSERAVKLGFEAIGVTNHGNVDGAVVWQRTLRKAGLQPIVGVEFYMVDDHRVKQKGDTRAHICFWVINQVGWAAVLRLITQSHLLGFYHKPRIDMAMLRETVLDGLICGTACIQSFFLKLKTGIETLGELNRLMPGRLYLEVMPHNMPEQNQLNKVLAEISEDTSTPLLATNDCHYVNKRHETVQEVMLAIQQNRKWTDPQRWKFNYKGLYLRSADEMAEAFEAQGVLSQRQYLRAMRNTLKVAEACREFKIEKGDIGLPEVKPGEDVYLFIDKVCTGKMQDLFGGLPKEYRDRYLLEYNLIKSKNFGRYFRMVADLIDHCKSKGIAIGPGRGSVGGSLIAYLMGITVVDPIRWDLSFERFISADRIDLPDIDIDVEKYRRGEAREYLEKKYGEFAVAGISTFGEIGGRAAVRDIGRVFDWASEDVNEFANAIPYNNTPESGKLSGVDTQIVSRFRAKYPDGLRYITELEGQIRNVGQHAAAVVVAEYDLRYSPRCSLRSGSDGKPLVNWAMEDAEFNGLVKIDLLGLSTLSVFSEAERLIRCRQKDFQLWDVDPAAENLAVFQLIGEGRTAGIFQLSASASTRLCQDLRPENFEEIVAIMALVRPGPKDSGMTDEYLRRRRSGRWERQHPIYEEITAKTYGILVYQEQVMRVISRVAGLPENTADKIRKIIGKKRDPEEFRPYWELFRDGCLKSKTMTEREAETFWEGLQKWAGYGFNRAHSVEYAILAYWSAWLKIHFPLEFFCAFLSFGEFDDKREDKSRQRVLDEMAALGLDLTPPKVGKSDPCKWTTDGKSIFVPFVEIKGVGEETAAKCAGASKDKECPGGFFNLGTFGGSQSGTSKVEKILREIGAYDMDRRDFPPEYFSFCAGRGGGGGMPDSHPRGLTKRTAGERVNKSVHDKAPTTSPAGSTTRNHRRT